MNIEPIGIKIEDNNKFGLIAFLVDREDFLNDISSIRKTLKLSKMPYELPNIPKELRYLTNAYKKGGITVGQVRTLLQEFCLSKGINLKDLDETLASAYTQAEALMKKYKKKRSYIPVILASILTGVIGEADFMTTYAISLNSGALNQALSANLLLNEWPSDEELVALVINRESKLEEVNSLFTWHQKYTFGRQHVEENDRMAQIMEDKMQKYERQHAFTNIKRDRNWYWINKRDGLGYQRIWKQTKETYKAGSPEVVAKAIQQYKRMITNNNMET